MGYIYIIDLSCFLLQTRISQIAKAPVDSRICGGFIIDVDGFVAGFISPPLGIKSNLSLQTLKAISI